MALRRTRPRGRRQLSVAVAASPPLSRRSMASWTAACARCRARAWVSASAGVGFGLVLDIADLSSRARHGLVGGPAEARTAGFPDSGYAGRTACRRELTRRTGPAELSGGQRDAFGTRNAMRPAPHHRSAAPAS